MRRRLSRAVREWAQFVPKGAGRVPAATNEMPRRRGNGSGPANLN